MTTYWLKETDIKLPATAQVGDIVIYGDDTYRLYEDPQRGLRMHHLGDAQAYLAQEREVDALANEMRQALSGLLADPERQNMAAIAEAQVVDLEMTQAAACGRWGY